MEDDVKEGSLEDKHLLRDRVQELKCCVEALLAENDMFERYISRVIPPNLGSPDEEEAEATQQEHKDGEQSPSSRSSVSDPPRQLTLEQKLFVAQREVTETRQDLEKLKERYDTIQDNYKASMKEAEFRLAELRRGRNVFKHRLQKHMKDNRVEKKEPEKVLQYVEDRSTVVQVEKFHLKNKALRAIIKKCEQKLQQLKEARKAKYEEIFQDYGELIIDSSLNVLQVNCHRVQRLLSSSKDMLQIVTLELNELSSDINNKNQMLVRIEEETQHAEEERLKAEALNKHLRRQMTDYQAPDIIEYMHIKNKRKKLQKSIRTWERRVIIAQMALQTCTKAGNKQKDTVTPESSAEGGVSSEGNLISVKLPHIAAHST